MKNYLAVLVLVLSVCFTSCDKEDDQNNIESVLGCTDETAYNYDASVGDNQYISGQIDGDLA